MKTSVFICSDCKGWFQATGKARINRRFRIARGGKPKCPGCAGVPTPEVTMVMERMTPAETMKVLMGFAKMVGRGA